MKWAWRCEACCRVSQGLFISRDWDGDGRCQGGPPGTGPPRGPKSPVFYGAIDLRRRSSVEGLSEQDGWLNQTTLCRRYRVAAGWTNPVMHQTADLNPRALFSCREATRILPYDLEFGVFAIRQRGRQEEEEDSVSSNSRHLRKT